MRLVIALGGKALGEPGAVVDPLERSPKIAKAAAVIAELAADNQVVVTHGFGPRVGLLAMLAETEHAQQRFPLDMIGAEHEGVVGHQLDVALRNACPNQRHATLLMQVEVAADDPAFAHYTMPIGPSFPNGEPAALEIARERGWHLKIEGEFARRVVPAPKPIHVFDVDVIAGMLNHGTTVICADGGGMPLAIGADGRLEGVEAVVEKERSAAVLATALHADVLLMISDVPNVERDWGTENAQPITSIVSSLTDPQDFVEGSMRPKVEAACGFVEATGARAAIGVIEDAVSMVHGTYGTQIVPALHESRSDPARDAAARTERDSVA
jgi:carbamate kinase